MKASFRFLTAGLALCAASSAHAIGIVTLVDLGGGLQTINQFDSSAPLISTALAVTGLPAGQTLLGIDFRPANGGFLYGLSSGSALYTINLSSGAVTIVGSTFSTLLNGTSYGFDFNPMIDRIRVVGDSDQNLVINPDTGAVQAVATPVFYAAGDTNVGKNPNVINSAYTSSAQLYGIDSAWNVLVTQANSAGTLVTVGGLGPDIDDIGGFDIGSDGVAYAALSVGGLSGLYTINLQTGAATSVGALAGTVTGLSVVPEPSSAVLLGLGVMGLLGRRRRN